MTYKKTVPTVYAVFFEDKGVPKVGYSGHQRWRNWVARGAVVVALEEFDSAEEARVFESRTLKYLSRNFHRAFASREEARAAVGIGAGGYSEFYRIPQSIRPIDVLTSLPVVTE